MSDAFLRLQMPKVSNSDVSYLLETTMSDDPKKTGADRKLVSLTEEHEVRSWTQSFGCTREQLEKAVAAVGNSAEAVRAYLGTQK